MMEEKLFKVIASVLEIPENRVNPELSLGDVEKWDSLGHLELILAVEEAFGVKFNSTEISELTSVGKIAARLKEILGA
ncbi:acyl carrier protein [Candidatus Bathyarchaeota archaeon]|nr:MAG: acyl carrier protein [Candidatus Bathyarchaeota archaeon]